MKFSLEGHQFAIFGYSLTSDCRYDSIFVDSLTSDCRYDSILVILSTLTAGLISYWLMVILSTLTAGIIPYWLFSQL